MIPKEFTTLMPGKYAEYMTEFIKVDEKYLQGYIYRFEFENGYGASVVKNTMSYGHERDLFEMAVMKDGKLCYDTSITADVLGSLTNDQVLKNLGRIKRL